MTDGLITIFFPQVSITRWNYSGLEKNTNIWEQLLCLELGSDRNLAGPPEGCFSVQTEIQTATYRDVMLVVYKHTILEQERWRLLIPLSFGDFVQDSKEQETAFSPYCTHLLPSLQTVHVLEIEPGEEGWAHIFPLFSLFSLLVLCISCPLLLLSSPVLCLFQSLFISLSSNFFIPALQLHFLVLTPLHLFVARAREWCLSYSTSSIKLAVIRHAAIVASSAAWAVTAHALLLAHSS